MNDVIRDDLIGKPISELDSPALCIDLDIMQANMQAMMNFHRAQGKQWRPHVKCHKVPAIAQQQMALGALGVTSAKSSEAAVFVEAGVSDVLIANMIIGEQKLQRVARLCAVGRPIVACDHFVQAEALSDVCRQRGVTCRVIVEVDLGLNRVGVRPGPDAQQLVRGIDRLPGVELVGIMGYEGHLLTEPESETKHKQIFTALGFLEELRDVMFREGMNCEIVSAGGTGSYQITATHPAVTELQAGGGIFADPFYAERCGVSGLSPALRMIATVVSRGSLDRAVLDTGRKAIHPDIHPPQVLSHLNGRPIADAVPTQYSAEHLTLQLGPQAQDLMVGDRILLIPGYSDHTTVLHNRFYGIRDGQIECIWPIAARGCLQ